MINYAALKVEITADPDALGYAGKSDPQIIALLIAPNYTLPRGTVSAQDFMASIKLTELLSLSTQNIEALRLYVAVAVIDISDPDVETAFGTLFPQASCPNSFAGIQALLNKPASRAEVLFGAGTTLTTDDLLTARRQ